MLARDAIALAADLPLPQATALYDRISSHVGIVKVGLSLFVEHGPLAVKAFCDRGARVFLDLKLHDIPNTVELASARAAALGVSYLTVHAAGGTDMLAAAVRGAQSGAQASGHAPPEILAVTVLTSMNPAALTEVVGTSAIDEQVDRLAAVAVKAGVGGLVCSAKEVSRLRQMKSDLILCTPGIRPEGSAANDQSRVETPATAISSGATFLVIGRPIYAASDPLDAARRIEREVHSAISAL